MSVMINLLRFDGGYSTRGSAGSPGRWSANFG
jgi:hypothetical protein